MEDISENNSYETAVKLAKPIKFLGISFLAAIISNFFIIGLFRDSLLVYLLVPFNLIYIFCVAWLAKEAYGWFMAMLSIISVIFPIFVFIIMLLSYNRASKKLKALGYKASFSGGLVEV